MRNQDRIIIKFKKKNMPTEVKIHTNPDKSNKLKLYILYIKYIYILIFSKLK